MGTLTCHPDAAAEFIHSLHTTDYDWEADEGASPLQVLADRLIVGPPSIMALIQLLEESDYIQEFLELIREYLPDDEREILAGSMDSRCETFCRLFSAKYFELDDDMLYGLDDPIAELVRDIPVRLMGLSYEDYHEFDSMNDGMVLMLSVIANPWIEPDEDEEAARVPLLEKVADLVGKEITEKIPALGWDTKYLHEKLDGTKYSAVARFADWVWQDTGIGLLDQCYEQMGCGWNGQLIPWDRDTVEAITEEWPKVREFWSNLNSFEDWLLDSPQANFDELVCFLMGNPKPEIPKEQLPLPLDDIKPKTLYEIFGNERLKEGLTDEDIIDATNF